MTLVRSAVYKSSYLLTYKSLQCFEALGLVLGRHLTFRKLHSPVRRVHFGAPGLALPEATLYSEVDEAETDSSGISRLIVHCVSEQSMVEHCCDALTLGWMPGKTAASAVSEEGFLGDMIY